MKGFVQPTSSACICTAHHWNTTPRAWLISIPSSFAVAALSFRPASVTFAKVTPAIPYLLEFPTMLQQHSAGVKKAAQRERFTNLKVVVLFT